MNNKKDIEKANEDFLAEQTQHLSKDEKEQIKKFVKDEEMYNAVKARLLMGAMHHDTLEKFIENPGTNWVLASEPEKYSDEEYGKIMRGAVNKLNHIVGALSLMEYVARLDGRVKSDMVNEAK